MKGEKKPLEQPVTKFTLVLLVREGKEFQVFKFSGNLWEIWKSEKVRERDLLSQGDDKSSADVLAAEARVALDPEGLRGRPRRRPATRDVGPGEEQVAL